jgi:short-subunit dehydrogenase
VTFRGKHILITGAGRGLGAAFAVIMADLGASLTLTGRRVEALNVLAEQIDARCGVKPDVAKLDLADLNQVAQFTEDWRSRNHQLDILINNGAGWLSGGIEENSDSDIANIITGNVTGGLLLTRGVLPLLRASQFADIVNIISISGMPNVPLQTASVAFAASKAGQAAMTDGLRQELRGQGIRITALYPPNIRDVSPLIDLEWNSIRSADSWVDNRDVVDMTVASLKRARHISYCSLFMESDTSNFHFHVPVHQGLPKT